MGFDCGRRSQNRGDRLIVTTYSPDGVKTRKPIGYAGNQCHAATRPYEAREIGTVKTPTGDACLDPQARVAVDEKQTVGG